jgi:hypothetical protein
MFRAHFIDVSGPQKQASETSIKWARNICETSPPKQCFENVSVMFRLVSSMFRDVSVFVISRYETPRALFYKARCFVGEVLFLRLHYNLDKGRKP